MPTPIECANCGEICGFNYPAVRDSWNGDTPPESDGDFVEDKEGNCFCDEACREEYEGDDLPSCEEIDEDEED